MVGQYEDEYVYYHPWSVVSEALWRKYPHPLCPHVLDVDVIFRYIDSQKRQLMTRRLFTGTSPVPRGFRWLVDCDEAYAVEDSAVDVAEKRIELNLRSLSLRDLVDVRERCVYEQHPDNKDWTLLRQQWSCHWKVPGPLVGSLENISVERFRATVSQGRHALQLVCEEVQQSMKDDLTAR